MSISFNCWLYNDYKNSPFLWKVVKDKFVENLKDIASHKELDGKDMNEHTTGELLVIVSQHVISRDEFGKKVKAMGLRLSEEPVALFCKRVIQKIYTAKKQSDTAPPVSLEVHRPQSTPSSTVSVAPSDTASKDASRAAAYEKIKKLLSDGTNSQQPPHVQQVRRLSL